MRQNVAFFAWTKEGAQLGSLRQNWNECGLGLIRSGNQKCTWPSLTVIAAKRSFRSQRYCMIRHGYA